MQVFLVAKHWQLFVLIMIPLISLKFFSAEFSGVQINVMMLALITVVGGWWYAIGIAANEKLDESLRSNTVLFKIALVIPVAYILFLLTVYSEARQDGGQLQQAPQWVGIAYVAAMACLYYAIWFVARQFASLQKKERALYSEYAITMLGFLIAVLGVWFIQPKVNALFKETET